MANSECIDLNLLSLNFDQVFSTEVSQNNRRHIKIGFESIPIATLVNEPFWSILPHSWGDSPRLWLKGEQSGDGLTPLPPFSTILANVGNESKTKVFFQLPLNCYPTCCIYKAMLVN